MHLLECRRWKKKNKNTSKIRVYYGQDQIPRQDEPASGGIIKFQDLQNIFPNNPINPNLLYLVSSNLPSHLPVLLHHAKRAGVPIVLNQNGVAYPAWHGKGWEKMNHFLALAHSAADYIFYQSEFCRESAFRFLGKSTSRFEVLYNPVDTTYFRPLDCQQSLLRPIRLLLAGTHNQFYRVQSAIDTLARLKEAGEEVTLEIAGPCRWDIDTTRAETKMRNYVEAQALTASVTYTGPYSQKQARVILQRAHILLHTKYNDPCPRLIVEAMATGLPIVYSISGGTPELVGAEAGFGVRAPLDWDTIHPPAPEELAGAVQNVIRSYPDYARAARNRAVQRFDLQPWIARHQRLFGILHKGMSLE